MDSSYTEVLYAHLLDSDGSRLTYTHFTTKVDSGTLVEITFNRPVYIQKNKVKFMHLEYGHMDRIFHVIAILVNRYIESELFSTKLDGIRWEFVLKV